MVTRQQAGCLHGIAVRATLAARFARQQAVDFRIA